jgi:Na+-translocating ferredoxin:NAD+ oxidoreductase RNF subunit RnfB
MAFVIAEPCIGTKDTACVAACLVDCIAFNRRNDTSYEKQDARASTRSRRSTLIPWSASIAAPACQPALPGQFLP